MVGEFSKDILYRSGFGAPSYFRIKILNLQHFVGTICQESQFEMVDGFIQNSDWISLVIQPVLSHGLEC